MATQSDKITVLTVAKVAKVSAQTVSRVLTGKGYVSEPTRQRVQDAVAQLGYRPSAMGRSLRATRTPLVAFMVADITNPFYARLFKALEPALHGRGLTLMLLNSDDDPVLERQQLDLVASYRPTGLVISPSVDSTFSVSDLANFNHAVFVSRTLDSVPIPSIVTNECDAMAEATTTLVSQGHCHLLAVLGLPGTTTTVNRELGIRSVIDGRQAVNATIIYTDQTYKGAHQAVLSALQHDQSITGILAFNSQVTEGVLLALRDLDLSCPDDVSVIGFTDAGWMAFNQPPVTVVAQPVELMGERAAQILLDLIDGKQIPPKPHVVPSTLVERASVAAPRNISAAVEGPAYP